VTLTREELERLRAGAAAAEQLRPLQNLAWIGEAVARDPQLATRLQQTLLGPGAFPQTTAPVTVQAPSAEDIAMERTRILAPIQQKIQQGDISGALFDAIETGAQMGATRAREEMRREFGGALDPLMGMSVQNAVDSFRNVKRAGVRSFGKIEPKFNQALARIPAAELNDLARKGQLNGALEILFQTLVGSTYLEAEQRQAAAPRTQPSAPIQLPPTFGGGNRYTAPSQAAGQGGDDDEAEWAALEAAGVRFFGSESEIA
jgi:hypothetical protein